MKLCLHERALGISHVINHATVLLWWIDIIEPLRETYIHINRKVLNILFDCFGAVVCLDCGVSYNLMSRVEGILLHGQK